MQHPPPSVGDIVHYVSLGTPPRADGSQQYPSLCRAAIVTEAGEDGVVGAAVLNPAGLHFDRSLPYSEERAGGSWHWPERV